GEQRCHLCGGPVAATSAAEIVDEILALPAGTKLTVLAPVVTERKGEHGGILEEARKKGFVRARIDGHVVRLEDAPGLDKKRKPSIALVGDRLSARAEARARITDAVELCLRTGEGQLILAIDGQKDAMRSEKRACPTCGIGFPELSPISFSFNSPLG